MKKPTLISIITLLTLMPLAAPAGQNTDSAKDHRRDQQKSKKPVTISGKVGSDGKTLTADKDSRIWQISNPETLSGIEGHRVRVKAHVDRAQGQIRVISVNAIPEERVGIKFDDAAFRR